MSEPGSGATVTRALSARLRAESTVMVQVLARGADPDHLMSAVQAGLEAVVRLRDPSTPRGRDPEQVRSAGPAVPVKDGVVMLLDLGELPPAVRVEAAELLANELTRAGLTGARVGLPPRVADAWWEIVEVGPAVRCHLRPPLGVPFGSAGTQGAHLLLASLLPDLRVLAGDLPLHLLVGSAVMPAGWAEADRLGRGALDAGGVVTLVASHGVTSGAVGSEAVGSGRAGTGAAALVAIAVSSGGRGSVPQAAVTLLRAPGCPEVPAACEALRELARDRAGDLAWAGVSPYERVGGFFTPNWERHRQAEEFLRLPGVDVRLLPDEAVPGAGWWQLLSSKHGLRMGALPTGAVVRPDGRWELTFGEAGHWVPGAPGRLSLIQQAHETLGPLLLDRNEGRALGQERMRAATVRHPEWFGR